MTALVTALLNAVINEMRPRLTGCAFRVTLTDRPCNVSSYKPHAWGELDGQERKQKTRTRIRISGQPAAYVLTLYARAWDRATEAQKKLMLAVLIAPITAVPPGSASLNTSGAQTYRVGRRWGVPERLRAAEEHTGCTIKDLDLLIRESDHADQGTPNPAPTVYASSQSQRIGLKPDTSNDHRAPTGGPAIRYVVY